MIDPSPLADQHATPADAPTAPPPAPPQDWREKIPAPLKDKGFWGNVKSEEDLYTQFAELQRYRGQSIKVPGEGATEHDWQSIYNKLGRPESPDEYQVAMRDYDGKVQWAEGSEAWVKQTAHKLGLNNQQVQTLVDSYGELILSGATEAQQARNQAIEELRGQFGDLYERKLTLGERALKKIGGDEFAQYVEANGWTQDPVMVKAMIKMGAMFEEQNFIDGRVGSMSRGDAEARLRTITQDMNHPYWQGAHPGHKDALKEVQGLEDIVYG